MSAVTVPAVKQRITEIDTEEAHDLAARVAESHTKEDVLDRLNTENPT
jgi:phosphoenolpyruvate-protein kinase (PTS system EI component)